MLIDIKKIIEELKTLPEYDTQLILQKVNDSDDLNYGSGRHSGIHKESDFIIPIYPQLKYTNSIIEKLNMTRTRVLLMKPKTCYSYHIDGSKRIHIPLITNKSCFMVIEDKCYWYPADGNYYIADTTKQHTFVNASNKERIHIVGCINNT